MNKFICLIFIIIFIELNILQKANIGLQNNFTPK